MKKLLFLTFVWLTNTNIAQNWDEQILTQPNRNTSNHFGRSVSISGDYAVIGSSGENNQTGSAHVFKKDGNGNWNHIQKLTAFVGQHSDEYFGSVVKIVDDFIFVSAPTDRLNEAQFQTPTGSVFIFKNDGADNFVGLQRIRSSDASHGDHFGYSLDADGDYLVVGAIFEDNDINGQNTLASAGSAYVFLKDMNDNWNEVQKIIPSHRRSADNFGHNVAISGNTIIVGSNNRYDVNNANPIFGDGSVFVFEKNNADVWVETQKLKSTDRQQSSFFGFDGLDIHDNYIAVGARGSINSLHFESGAVYIFQKNNGLWSQTNQLFSEINNREFSLGENVKLHKNLLIATAPKNRVNNKSNAGGAFLFYNSQNNWSSGIEIVTSNPELDAYVGGGVNNNPPENQKNFGVDINGNHFILGAQLKNDNNLLDVGEAYVCNDIGSFIASLSTSTFTEEQVYIYPNPTKNIINLQLGKTHNTIKIQIYNNLGKRVFEKEVKKTNKFMVNLNVSSGIFFAKITLNNRFIKTVKLVKN